MMLQSYSLVSRKLIVNKLSSRKTSTKIYLFILIASFLAFIFTILSFNFIKLDQWRILLMVTSVFFGGNIANTLSEIKWKKSYLRDLIEIPVKTLTVTGILMLVNAFIHEYPNTFAKQWIYTAKTYTFFDARVLDIPLYVWVGWSALTIGPIAYYYLSHDFFSKKR